MSLSCPPVIVDLATPDERKFGLFSVAKTFPNLESHWISCGVQFMNKTCPDVQVWTENCTSHGSKLENPRPELESFDPFQIFSGWDCAAIGKSAEEHRADAIAALQCGAEEAIERAFYSGTDVDSATLITGAIPLNTAATPVSIPAGIGQLEGAMSESQCGEPVLHFPRELGGIAAAYHQTFGASGTLRTPLGSPVVFGAGYGNTAPDGTPPPAGVVWIYATGPVYLATSEAFMNPPMFEDALDRTNNKVNWEATQHVLLAIHGCVKFAVAVSTSLGG